MRIIREINKNHVLRIAMKLVRESKKTVHGTMILKEETRNLSKEYFTLMNKKVSSGLRVKRIGFGTHKDFAIARQQLGYSSVIVRGGFKLCSNTNLAQRMLIADKKKMIFAVYQSKDIKRVFYTENKFIVRGFLSYFDNLFSSL